MCEEDMLRANREYSLEQRQVLANDLLNMIEDSVLLLLGEVRNFRLLLEQNGSMRDKTVDRMYWSSERDALWDLT